jgi:hypothetical protein
MTPNTVDMFKSLAHAGYSTAAIALWFEHFDRGANRKVLRDSYAWLTEHDPDCGHAIHRGIMAGHLETYARLSHSDKEKLRETLAGIFGDAETFSEALQRAVESNG